MDTGLALLALVAWLSFMAIVGSAVADSKPMRATSPRKPVSCGSGAVERRRQSRSEYDANVGLSNTKR